ncbi:hypothetical protein LAU_0092 [Lausannevirus]|uniref:Uncharacterized protein n=1 Tax=Lausannevirus TaxID=999883 RepID=F2WL22_9VIRU|nr:hypothetical protein LAU_0092 [Lausannevirus]AEA06945.1 hypothetical protein LAU_0092 [Lausannevirus]
MSKKEYCVLSCVRKNNARMARIKGTDNILEDVYHNSNTWRACKAMCDNFRNSRAYVNCEKREWRKWENCGSVEECNKSITETCDNDLRVRISKALFYP